MPDNKHIDNQNPVDRGWQRMTALLDREMPTKRRRPFVAWLPWGLGGLAVLIAIGWWTFELDADKTKQEFPKESSSLEQSAAQSPDGAAETEENAILEKQTSKGLSETSASPGAQISEPAPVADESLSAQLVTRHLADSEPNPNPDRVAEATRSASYVSETKAVPSETDLISTTDTPVTEPLEVNTPVESTSSSHVLVEEPDEIHGFIALLDTAERAITPVSPRLPRDSHFGLEVFSSGHISDVIAVRGVEGGLAATFDISEKFTLRAGAAFGHYQKDGLLRFGGAKAHEQSVSDPLSSPTGGFITYDPSTEVWLGNGVAADLDQVSYDTTRLLAHAFNYLHFPVSVRYSLFTRLGITAGVQYSYLVSAPTKHEVIPDPTFSSRATKSFLYSNDLLRKHDVALRLGLDWKLSKDLSIDLAWHHGLIPYVDKSSVPDRSDFNRSLAVGVHYRIL